MGMTTLDPREAPFRPDLADARLQGQVEAAHFVTAKPYRVLAERPPSLPALTPRRVPLTSFSMVKPSK